MYKYIYPISKLLVILLVTLSSAAIIGTLMEAAGAQELDVFAISASLESLAPESDLSRKSTSQLDNSAQKADKPSTREQNILNAPLAASKGVFNPFTVYASGSWAEAVVSGEWDGDGKNDVMLVTGLGFDDANDNQGHLFEQTAPDTLTLTGSLEAGESPTALARGDFNHDGQDDDVAILSQGDNRLDIFLQSGGTLGGMSTYNTEDSPDSLAVL